MEYLDSRVGGGRLIPAAGIDRYACLTAAAKMDGIIDAALLMVYEGRFRPAERRVDRFVDWQRDKIIRALQSIEPAPYAGGVVPDVADIGLACALDYLDFRKPLSWRDHAPALADWQADLLPRSLVMKRRCRSIRARHRHSDAGTDGLASEAESPIEIERHGKACSDRRHECRRGRLHAIGTIIVRHHKDICRHGQAGRHNGNFDP